MHFFYKRKYQRINNRNLCILCFLSSTDYYKRDPCAASSVAFRGSAASFRKQRNVVGRSVESGVSRGVRSEVSPINTRVIHRSLDRTRRFWYGRVATVVIVSGTEGKTAACVLFGYRCTPTAVITGSSLFSVPYGYSSAYCMSLIIADITGLPSEINPHVRHMILQSRMKELVH